jgi:hypothetical protein
MGLTPFTFRIVGHETLGHPVSIMFSDAHVARKHAEGLYAKIKDSLECANGCRVVVLNGHGQVLFEVGQ